VVAITGSEATFDPNAPGNPFPVPIDGAGINAVACPTVTQCTAVDGIGDAVTFDPAAPAGAGRVHEIDGVLNAVACPSATQCTAVDAAGRAVTFDPSSPAEGTATRVPGANSLTGVACPSTQMCVAVDRTGNAFVATPPAPPSPGPGPGPIPPSGPPSGGGAPPPGNPGAPSGPTDAQIKSSLLRQLTPHGKASRIGALLRHGGYTFSFQALTGGAVVIQWHSGHVLVAVGKVTFTRAGRAKLIVKLTRAGGRLLATASPRLTLVAHGAFTPTARPVITAARRFHLRG
jgi:hypothetical protein